MRNVLGVASVLGVVGVIASFGLFYLGEQVFQLDRGMIQTLIYLKLSVAGHLTIFVTRTQRRFRTIRPAPILPGVALTTQAIATYWQSTEFSCAQSDGGATGLGLCFGLVLDR